MPDYWLARGEGRLGRRVEVGIPRAVAVEAGDASGDRGEFVDLERARLERADRLAAIGTLAAGIVHDIRNPLVSVRTFLQLLPERLDDEEFKTGFRELALAELDRVCLLINDLLSFSRPTARDREVTEVRPILVQMIRLLQPEARKADVQLDLAEDDDGAPRVLADECQLRQVVMNVVLNAIEATPPLGRVVVACGAEADASSPACVIEVSDTGRGLPDGDPARVFEAFYTTKTFGSGLGLYVARRIVSEHGGEIEALHGEGRGSRVRIRLPALLEGDGGT